MFVLCAEKSALTVCEKEKLASGSINVYQVRFEFSTDWDGLTRTAVFKGGRNSQSVPLDEDGVCTVPKEVLTACGCHLLVRVCGKRDGEIVLNTEEAILGMIWKGSNRKPQLSQTEDWEEKISSKRRLPGLRRIESVADVRG